MAAAAGAGRPHAYRIAIVGDAGVGKNSFARRFVRADFECVEDKSAEVFSIVMPTVEGDDIPVELRICQSTPAPDAFLEDHQAAIIMFSCVDRTSYKHMPMHYRDILRVCGHIPVAVLGNKAEVVERLVKAQELTYHRRKNLAYFDACVHANFNVVEVLEVLLGVLAGVAGLKIDRDRLELAAADGAAVAEVQARQRDRALYDPAFLRPMVELEDDEDAVLQEVLADD